MLNPARVTYEFSAPSGDELSQWDSTAKRTITIEPRTVQILAGGRHRTDGVLDIYIEGRTVKRDGNYGAQKRTVTFTDRPMVPETALTRAPEWLRPLIAEVRTCEAARLLVVEATR